MKRSLKVWMLAAALTMAGGYAVAQANPPKEEGSKTGMHGMHGMDHAKMAERMKRHIQHLKAEMEKLGMPERLDKMKEMHQKRHDMHMAEMEKRHAVVKTFYAVLTPDQKKVFDAKAQPKWPHGPQHG